ncbi:MAG: DNA-directed DNA polymerase I, partial [Candidatus Ranarchaeia archaeon]
TYRQLDQGELSLPDLAFRVQMTKNIEAYTKTTPQHVKAAKQYRTATGKQVPRGSIISFVKVTGSAGVKPIVTAKVAEIDVGKYKEFLETTFSQILDALSIEFADVAGSTTLDTFL